MRLGPDQVVACPHCKGLAKNLTLISGNTVGARTWTDGKLVAPMLPRPPAVVKCAHCRKCYWLADAEKLAGDAARAGIPWVEEPTADEYLLALDQGLAKDREQERTVRILAWWRGNDAFRSKSQINTGTAAPSSASFRENLEALAPLLDHDDDHDRIMKAEVFRELGAFQLTVELLNQVTTEKYAGAVRQLGSLCDRGDSLVRELRFGEQQGADRRKRIVNVFAAVVIITWLILLASLLFRAGPS